MPEEYDLTLFDPDGKLGRDIAIIRAEIEELHAKLLSMPTVIARAALGVIFSTAAVTTFLGGGSWRIRYIRQRLKERESRKP